MSATPPDLLVIAASNGENLKLAQRFASQASALDQTAEVLDLTTVDLPLFTPRMQQQGSPEAVAALEQQLMAAPRWVICVDHRDAEPPEISRSPHPLVGVPRDWHTR